MKTKSPAIPPQWAWHCRALLRAGHELTGESGEHVRAVRAGNERGGTDSIEVASSEAEHDTLFAEIGHEQAELAEIEAALTRLRLGTYGVCELSGAPIEAARLRALSWTRYSVIAAAKLERERTAARRLG